MVGFTRARLCVFAFVYSKDDSQKITHALISSLKNVIEATKRRKPIWMFVLMLEVSNARIDKVVVMSEPNM